MPNTIKYGTEVENNTLKKGDFVIGVNDVDYGPTNETGYHNTITPPSGGYVVYKNRGDNQRSIYVAESDEELVLLKDDFGATGSTANDVLVWATQQSDVIILNNPLDNIVTDGLVLYLDAGFTCSYPKSNTTWYDLSGNGNDGTLINGTTFSGGSIVFDGSNDYVTVPHNSSITPTSVTIDFWFSTDDVNQAAQALISKRTNYSSGAYWTYVTNKTFYFDTYQNGIQNRMTVLYNTLTSDTWYNLTFTYGTNGKFIYVNGGQIGSDVYGGVLTSTNVRLDIGNSLNSGNAYPLNGKISNAKIYNRALSAAEVLQNFNAQKSRFGL